MSYKGDPALAAFEAQLVTDGVTNWADYFNILKPGPAGVVQVGDRIIQYCPAKHRTLFDCVTGPAAMSKRLAQVQIQATTLTAISSCGPGKGWCGPVCGANTVPVTLPATYDCPCFTPADIERVCKAGPVYTTVRSPGDINAYEDMGFRLWTDANYSVQHSVWVDPTGVGQPSATMPADANGVTTYQNVPSWGAAFYDPTQIGSAAGPFSCHGPKLNDPTLWITNAQQTSCQQLIYDWGKAKGAVVRPPLAHP